MVILDILEEHLHKLENEERNKEIDHEIYSIKQEIHKYMEVKDVYTKL